MNAQEIADRLFSYVAPCGIVYTDRKREKSGDYLRLAFLPFSTLKLEWEKVRIPAEMKAAIEADAAKLAARAGEDFQISSSGQTVRLGSK
jgi:hypothetical protein